MQEITVFIKKHILLNLALLGVLFAIIFMEFIRQKKGGLKASPSEVIQLINRHNAKIVDIRTNSLYGDGHIIGSMNMPFSNFAEKSASLDKTKVQPIVIVCALGQESAQAAATLKQQGFTNVRILDGGIRAWRDAELPLVKD